MDIRKGAAIAAAVASLLAGCASDEEGNGVGGSSSELKCEGGNECKGMSECAGAAGKNECQGMNECKSMGWVTVETADACDELGGMLIEKKS